MKFSKHTLIPTSFPLSPILNKKASRGKNEPVEITEVIMLVFSKLLRTIAQRRIKVHIPLLSSTSVIEE